MRFVGTPRRLCNTADVRWLYPRARISSLTLSDASQTYSERVTRPVFVMFMFNKHLSLHISTSFVC